MELKVIVLALIYAFADLVGSSKGGLALLYKQGHVDWLFCVFSDPGAKRGVRSKRIQEIILKFTLEWKHQLHCLVLLAKHCPVACSKAA